MGGYSARLAFVARTDRVQRGLVYTDLCPLSRRRCSSPVHGMFCINEPLKATAADAHAGICRFNDRLKSCRLRQPDISVGIGALRVPFPVFHAQFGWRHRLGGGGDFARDTAVV